MNEWKEIFEMNVTKLEKVTDGKTKVRYEHQRNNGNWILVNSQDNNGMGTHIGVKGYAEAAHIVEGMLYMACIDKSGSVWTF